jgi:UDP:flavonoid glycosyltransferase YjiC (YdhE family)
LPDNVHVEAWLPQDEVLPHVDAAVGHGGFGTTLGALGHGVPMVLLPLFAGDQWRNARRVAELGAGLLVDDGERRVMEIPSQRAMNALPGALKLVLGDGRFRQSAARIRDEIVALPDTGAAVAVVEQLASPVRQAH